ncbi:phage tail fiber protein [Peribacillus loiseleuriae]|uniref:phage tail fiber protein n=1 Tax=Peribacillus loiseleuriae TaxID=1679170 RepID=UPI003D0079ED
MNHMSVYLKNKVLTDNLRTTPVYVALFNNDVEVSKASYARQAITFITPTDGQTSNSADVLFPIANESWGNITHIGIFDSSTGGNLLFKSPAEFVKAIDVSSQYKIPKNYLIVRLK